MSTAAPQGTAQGCVSSGVVVSAGRRVGGVVFDAPDVLYDATHWRRWLFQLLVRFGAAGSYIEFCRQWDGELIDVHRGRREYAEALHALLLSRGLSWAQIDEIEAASRIQRQSLELDVRPLAGVVRVIGELGRRRLPLAAWADAPLSIVKLTERLERILPQASFAGVSTSFELECTQPEAACYQAMAQSLGLVPGEVLYVGHDAAHLAGARAAGMTTAAVNFEPAAQADYLLAQFDELVGIVEREQAAPRRANPQTLPAAESRPMVSSF